MPTAASTVIQLSTPDSTVEEGRTQTSCACAASGRARVRAAASLATAFMRALLVGERDVRA
ncbi:Uncharacterised protein [Bordetella pertussis]|nr:Uncharacterised protein [Bordetella pertussis]CFW45938.1 Uncharacterised protein [Bordetella pertussis]